MSHKKILRRLLSGRTRQILLLTIIIYLVLFVVTNIVSDRCNSLECLDEYNNWKDHKETSHSIKTHKGDFNSPRQRINRSIIDSYGVNITSLIISSKSKHLNQTVHNSPGNHSFLLYYKDSFVEIDTKNVKEAEDVRKVLIVASYRTGSSFFGKMLDLYPETFYWYEPLGGLFQEYYKKHDLKKDPFYNGFKHQGRTENKHSRYIHSASLQTLVDIFTCNITSLSKDVLLHYFVLKNLHSRKMRFHFSKCMLRGGISQAEANLDACLPSLEFICRYAPMIVIKTIRMSLSLVEDLMIQIPSLQVLHLVRDPRGTIQSRNNAFNYGRIPMLMDISDTCEAMRQDIVSYDRLSQRYPDRIWRVRFEDLAMNPIQLGAKVYEFLCLGFREDIQNWLIDSTHSDTESDLMGLKRNATAVVSKWKYRLDDVYKVAAKKWCSDVLSHFKYEVG